MCGIAFVIYHRSLTIAAICDILYGITADRVLPEVTGVMIVKKNKLSITTPLLAATTVLLIFANLLLGIVLMRQSRHSMRSLIRARMLDVSNTAADMIDGDTYEKLTAEDVDTPEYQQTLRTLRSFLDNIELEYIYGVRQEGDRFVFTIDPADDAAEFGEEIETTEALLSAAKGKADVDDVPYSDRWGRFYSSYSPIFNSKGEVVGMIAVDFSADWYESRIKKQMTAVVLVCSASTIVGILMAFTLSARLRKRFNTLYDEMNDLANDFKDLSKLIQTDDIKLAAAEPSEGHGKNDELTELGGRIRVLRSELRQYITYVRSQAYSDQMTGVGSKTAYLNKVKKLNRLIAENGADFAVAVFDINGLKNVNDNFGHEMGDRFITGAAKSIKEVFGASNVYRIGGDEFIAVVENSSAGQMRENFKGVEKAIDELNRAKAFPAELAVSMGADVYVRGKDTDYQQVFKRADEAMYSCKCEYYKRCGRNGG